MQASPSMPASEHTKCLQASVLQLQAMRTFSCVRWGIFYSFTSSRLEVAFFMVAAEFFLIPHLLSHEVQSLYQCNDSPCHGVLTTRFRQQASLV